ncbi:glyoxalase/bleomycin resistance/extradiol dioxygenase family protein [Streptomyces carminius]|uniref:Glyoxalase/bleomycin resistance/extradiol dioxygenase family protein n=1 Tax=Streptomyces carminius TaxID=2665496 RepID=A0A2M8MCT5_9ACTN|nr:VOC family protein [Streptomyces carminius]PJF02018.1 glyoxalase/bleomycin resistance/extradiol dioxygenase family protein [Streptomyces carminius]
MTQAATRHAPGVPSWVSLLVRDSDASREFYHELFGWEYRPGPGEAGQHFRAVLDGRQVACLTRMRPGVHRLAGWLPYLRADDADRAAELARMCGGTVGVGPLGAEGMGRVAVASDPGGATFGIWQSEERSAAHMNGGPGTVVWHELITPRTSLVEKFYETVFGLEAEAVREPPASVEPAGSAEPVSAAGAGEETDYLTVSARGRIVGGIHGVGAALPRDRGSHWLMYVEVADTDAAVRRVTELGGRVLRPPQDTPRGRVARVADREGAPFAVITDR